MKFLRQMKMNRFLLVATVLALGCLAWAAVNIDHIFNTDSGGTLLIEASSLSSSSSTSLSISSTGSIRGVDFRIDTKALERFVVRNRPLRPFATWKKAASFCPERPMSKCEKAFYDGEWLASTYVWNEPGATDCNLRYMSTKTIKSILKGKKIFVIGDSLMRRLARTISAAITANDEQGIDSVTLSLDVHNHDKIIFDNGQISWEWAPHFKEIESKIREDKRSFVKNADIILLGDGAHYPYPSNDTDAIGAMHEELERFVNTTSLLRKRYPNKVFLYRSYPRPDLVVRKPVNTQVQEVVRCFSTLPILNHNRLMKHRDTGKLRMAGNSHSHMNGDALIFFLQSFVNYYQNFLS